MFRSRRTRRRARIRKNRFPNDWRGILTRHVLLYRYLFPEDQRELESHVLVFLDEKRFEGAAGLEITDEIRVAVAGHACILLMHRDTDYYPGLYSIIVYPGPYRAKTRQRDPLGFVQEAHEPRAGESSSRGAIVLSWRDLEGARRREACYNVAVHEFAHQLDGQDGEVEGTPILPDSSKVADWARILGREFESLREASSKGRPTLLRAYGAKNPGEFFAVASECFFTRPGAMREEHPELYAELQSYYRLDPASLMEQLFNDEGLHRSG